MTEYVIQIDNVTERLVKSYEVTPDYPIRQVVPEDRTQVIMTDTQVFNDAVAAYKQYKGSAHYFWDGNTLTWVIV